MADGASAAQLKLITIDSFEHYVALTEARMALELSAPNSFLWLDRQPQPRRLEVLDRLRHGQVVSQQLQTLENGQPIPVPQGMIHHWIATVFIPGVNLAETLAQQQDFNRGGDVYGPDIQSCKVLRAEGNDFHVYYRLHRKVIVTANYNANFDIHFVPIDPTHEYSRSYSTRIAELVDAGLPDESERPVGTDHGYLWRLNSYTRYEERDGGVYVQTEFLALSRSVPAIFAWLVDPYVKSVPQDYLTHLLAATRNDLIGGRAGGSHEGANGATGTTGTAVRGKDY